MPSCGARCRLVSLKVLDDEGNSEVSNLMAAIAHIQEKNGHGPLNLIQGVKISFGYNSDPEWFACGQSPLCVEINCLVRSGVVVVVAAEQRGCLGHQPRDGIVIDFAVMESGYVQRPIYA